MLRRLRTYPKSSKTRWQARHDPPQVISTTASSVHVEHVELAKEGDL